MLPKHGDFLVTLHNNLYATKPRLVGVAEQERELIQVLESSKQGTHTSILLIGNRGSGKSAVLTRALDHLDKTYPETTLVRIELDGYIQTDDVVSMYEIVRQLSRAIEAEDPAIGGKARKKKKFKAPRFCENFDYLCDMLKERMQKTRPVVFVLDNFELFAMRTKQTLLYNLFDLLQANEGALAIVGMTQRKDVFDLLEKRVKSRFSHQKVHFFPPMHEKQVLDLLQMALHLPMEKADARKVERHNSAATKLLEDPEILAMIKSSVNMFRPWGFYILLMANAIASLDATGRNTPVLTKKAVLGAYARLTMNYSLEMARNLSVLELTILITLIKLERKEMVPYNYCIIAEYLSRVKRRGDLGVRQTECNKRTLLTALLNFKELGLVIPVTNTGKRKAKTNNNITLQEYQMYRLSVDPWELAEFLEKQPSFGGQLKRFLQAII